MKNLFDIIRNEALRENAELKKDKLRGHNLYEGKGKDFSKNIDPKPFFRAPIVDLTERPISLKSYINFDPNVRSTYGNYTIKYVPASRRLSSKHKAYQIITDLLGFVPSVSGPLHWHHLCDRIPELKWLERNTNLTDEMFGIAKRHPGVPFAFCVNWVEYDKKIQKIAESERIDIDNKTFVTYMTTTEKLEELNEQYLLSPVRSKEECAREIAEFDKIEEEEVDIAHADVL